MIKLKNQCLLQFKLSAVPLHTSTSPLISRSVKEERGLAPSLPYRGTLTRERNATEKEQTNKQFSFLAPCVEERPFNNVIKGIVGHPLKAATLNHYTSKEIVYSFNKVNNLNPLLMGGAPENLLKSFFLSMFSLISKPIFLIRHDKVIIRLFVFL